MTDARIVSIAITLFAIAAGSIFNKIRISDSAAMLNKRIDDTKEVLRAEMKRGFAQIDAKLDTLLRMMGEHETRITKLEQRQ